MDTLLSNNLHLQDCFKNGNNLHKSNNTILQVSFYFFQTDNEFVNYIIKNVLHIYEKVLECGKIFIPDWLPPLLRITLNTEPIRID